MKKTQITKRLAMAKLEVEKYKKTKNEQWLYQSAEKCWTAYILFIELIAKGELKSRAKIDKFSWMLIEKVKIKRELYERANYLHVYHYEGRTSIPFVLNNITFVSKNIKNKLARI